MRRAPLISLSVKAGLVLFVVVAGALAIVYLAVVPQLENRLVDAKIRELELAAPNVAQLVRDLDYIAMDDVVRTQGESLTARVIVLERLTDDQLRNVADSRNSRFGDFSTDEFALEAARTQQPASGRSEQDGEHLAEYAYPATDELVVLLERGARRRAGERPRSSAAACSSPAPPRSWSPGSRATCSPGGSPAGSAGSRPAPSGWPTGTSRPRSWTRDGTRSDSSPMRSTPCVFASRCSIARAGSSSPTPRTS